MYVDMTSQPDVDKYDLSSVVAGKLKDSTKLLNSRPTSSAIIHLAAQQNDEAFACAQASSRARRALLSWSRASSPP